MHGSPSVTYTMVRGRIAHQTLQIQLFDGPRLTKHDVYNGLGDAWLTKHYNYNGLNARVSPEVMYTMVLGTHGLPNLTYTLVWWRMAHQPLHIAWYVDAFSPNHTNTIVWISMAHQTLRIHRFVDTWLTKPYKYISFLCYYCFICFPSFPYFTIVYWFLGKFVKTMKAWK